MIVPKWIKRNWFLTGLVAVVLLAWLFPDPGARDGVMHSALVTRWGVILVFFFQGLTLSLTVFTKGLMQWRLHLFVQVFIFLIIPLVVFAMITVAAPLLTEELKLGFIFLAVLPTTIATSVAYTSMVGGNIAGAVFNSTFANMAGIFITPLWIRAWMQVGGVATPLGQLLWDISLTLLAPLVLGQMFRPLAGRWADRHKKRFATLTSIILLFIVYAAFCNSWKQKLWSSQGTATIVVAAVGVGVLFFLILGLTTVGIRSLGFTRENAMAALFCAPQKTLAAGVPLANLIFIAHPGLGVILLPIMLYHPLQLLVGGLLINRINESNSKKPAERL